MKYKIENVPAMGRAYFEFTTKNIGMLCEVFSRLGFKLDPNFRVGNTRLKSNDGLSRLIGSINFESKYVDWFTTASLGSKFSKNGVADSSIEEVLVMATSGAQKEFTIIPENEQEIKTLEDFLTQESAKNTLA